ncbi:uncharacterized protein [Physcomitrium patens]|uniref:BRO1 domain-containing protein n=1 Tax=Physcomitrium patens TaxID=3218 RepID=A0A2K1L2A0_PHYPA|nr:uncharacterized protein LOC112278930 isoform X1 [Physcomitrium patens]XP_024368622.1 uncharacterized protein LOC112278930 isoform X1 [Physcomitrium patens]PNR60146.1 hypothetical protein PHYPA_002939 [Physcomitrium patens]|eukprot:XP_024368621.1 uncharacterized protein LOC112278930 isoform X1 [Physcomitrella patens]
MGCIFSTEAVDDGGVLGIPVQASEVYVFVPGLRNPKHIDLTELLKGYVSAGLAAKLQSLRSQIISIACKSGPAVKIRRRKSLDGSSVEVDLETALNSYLPVLVGLVTGGDKFGSDIEYPWTNVEDEHKETALASGYYELLSVLHLLGMLALQEANLCLTPRPSADGFNPKASEGMCFALHPVFTFGRYISASLSWYSLTDEDKRDAIDILLKAASYFECALSRVLPNISEHIKEKLPAELTEAMLKSLEKQALGQAVELQLGFAISNVKASLAVKRRLACEQVEVWEQAMENLVRVPLAEALRDKHILFVKWKLADAKAAAYYFHGLILDEGYEANAHAEALSCLKAAYAHLKESQKVRTEFSNMEPFTKVPPVWGPMKYLAERIPRETMSKGRIFKDNYSKEKFPASTPKLPEFPIALEADPFNLPPVDPAWKRERGFEGRTSQNRDLPSFLATKKSLSKTQLPVSDLRRAGPMDPALVVSEMVQAR